SSPRLWCFRGPRNSTHAKNEKFYPVSFSSWSRGFAQRLRRSRELRARFRDPRERGALWAGKRRREKGTGCQDRRGFQGGGQASVGSHPERRGLGGAGGDPLRQGARRLLRVQRQRRPPWRGRK